MEWLVGWPPTWPCCQMGTGRLWDRCPEAPQRAEQLGADPEGQQGAVGVVGSYGFTLGCLVALSG